MDSDTVSKPLTAEERRQRRMKKILENSESRMNTILSGPDGEEKRSAPAMEGGEGFNIARSVAAPTPVSTPIESCSTPRRDFSLLTFLEKRRRLVSLLFGLLCRLTMLYTGFQANIFIPWVVLYVSTELFVMRHHRANTGLGLPEEFQAILQMMPKEALPFNINYIGSAMTLFREMWKDTMFMAAGFLWTQYSLVLTDFYL